MNSVDKKIRELKSILRELQSMELHPKTGVIEMRSQHNLPVRSTYQHQHGVPSLPPDQMKYLSTNPKNGPGLSTILFTIFLSATLSSSAIAYILYKDDWFPAKSVTSTISLVKSKQMAAPVQRAKTVSHTSETDNLLEAMKFRTQRQIEVANGLVRRGKITAAREILLKLTRNEARFSNTMYAKVALALARSYDVNVLKSIPSPDAYPDIVEAEYWHREWYKVSAEIKSAESKNK
ncbi:MAG: hypothetical protein ACRBBN_17450 [Methyloligellaceae bacterium]